METVEGAALCNICKTFVPHMLCGSRIHFLHQKTSRISSFIQDIYIFGKLTPQKEYSMYRRAKNIFYVEKPQNRSFINIKGKSKILFM